MRLKNHESPRKIGRNRKGKGGSAKARQYRKRHKNLVRTIRKEK